MGGDTEKKPAGGLDKTPLPPTSQPTYTVRVTFHSANNIPIADFGKRSSDPYILAQINTGLPTRHPTDPPLRYRTHTEYTTTSPQWESSWLVAGIPESGFTLKVRLFDEDPEDHDDRLGKLNITTGNIKEGYKINNQTYKMKKTGSDGKAYALRWCTTMIKRDQKMNVRMNISVEVVGKTEEEVGKAYTLNCFWWKHFSPMVGRLAGTKAQDDNDGVEKANFQSNEIQLRGPVPNELYHRFVEFKPFIAWMFTRKGISGWALHKALHHQHERLYNFDTSTKYGRFDGPCESMTSQFLDLVHYDQGGRIFTYVITLDGMFRFTETGKEFGIDMLSKHTMHSDVQMYIAWSGEFLIRRLEHPNESHDDPNQVTHPPNPTSKTTMSSKPPTDPKFYELIIDNDSGTYRPEKSLLPILKSFLEKNLIGLQIVTMACDDDELDKIKKEQVKVKKEEGENMVFGQQSVGSSISSSDVSDLEDRAAQGGGGYTGKVDKGFEALSEPKKALKSVLPGKGKREREKREEKADTAVTEKTNGQEAELSEKGGK